MKEKTLLKIAFVLTIIAIILYGISVITYASDEFMPYESSYYGNPEKTYRFILPGGEYTIHIPGNNFNDCFSTTFSWGYTVDQRATEYGVSIRRFKYKIKNGQFVDPYIESDSMNTRYGSQQVRPKYSGSSNSYFTYMVKLTNRSDMIAVFSIPNDISGGVSASGGFSTYEEAKSYLDSLPKLNAELLEGNTYKPYKNNSVRFNVEGENLPDGYFNISLHKKVNDVKTRVATIYTAEWDNSQFSDIFDCGMLELGQYEIDVIYTYEDTNTGLTRTAFASLSFTIEESELEDERYSVSLGGQSIQVDKYFNQIWQIEYPKKNILYNVVPQLKFKGNEFYLSKLGLLQYWNYNTKFLYNSNLWSIFGEHYPKVNIYLNNHLIDTVNFSTLANLNLNYTIPESKLNRGLNTVYITTYNYLSYSDDYVDFYKDGGYRYLFSGVDFYYKSSEGSNPDIPPDEDLGHGPGGIDWGEVPDRSNYREDWIGDIQYGIDYLAYLISLPFKVIFGGIEFLVSNFTNMFSWVGSLTAMIGEWFGFIPAEIRLLTLGVIVCTFVGFAISIFKK